MKYFNNPLNIRFSKCNKFVGLRGENNGFCEFSSVVYCIRACILILRSYNNQGCKTISGIINKWAPPSENSTSNYISFVCDRMNLHRNYVINVFNPLLLFKFISSLCKFETGYSLNDIDFDEAYKLVFFKDITKSIL